MSDTIAAIATVLSPSAIGILRLSGPDTKAVLDAVFFPLNGRPMSQQTPRTMVLGRVLDGEGRVLDSALCVLFLLVLCVITLIINAVIRGVAGRRL